MNQLILGDCLQVLKTIDTETIDLIYLDPPFFSNRNYEVIWGDTGEIRSFEDRWSGGIDHYIAWLKERVLELHRVLKPTGSIFLHCDWHAVDSVWDIGILSSTNQERIGYPTQKSEALKVSELRLNKQRDLFSIPFTVQLHKYDYDTLRNNNAFEFETWIIQQYGGIPNTKQRRDLGIDGRNKDGKQTQTFKAGAAHCVAVKVIDNDGLEHTEMLNLKLNETT